MTPLTPQSIAIRDNSLYGRIIVGVLLLVCALYSIQIIAEADFMQDYAAARGWWQGLDPNAHTADLLKACCPGVHSNAGILQTAHPPFATLLSLPFSFLPWTLARHVWLLIGWVAIVWSWHVHRVHWFVCFATAGLWLVGLSLGTLEPLLFALLAAALLVEERSPRLAGVFIGIAGAIKIYPIVLLIGPLICRRWQVVITGTVLFILALLSAELILGRGVTQAWLAYTPINTLTNVDAAGSNSLVRVAHALAPSIAPTLLALILGIALVLPIISTLHRSDGLRPMLPIMLLISPISWSHYMALLVLGPVSRIEQALLAMCSILIGIVWLRLMPGANLAPIGYGPLLLVLLLMWYRQVRLQARQARQATIPAAVSVQQDEIHF